eukprot:5708986-Prymnesium_polylepis.2
MTADGGAAAVGLATTQHTGEGGARWKVFDVRAYRPLAAGVSGRGTANSAAVRCVLYASSSR